MAASFYGELLIRISLDNKAMTAGLADSAAKTKAFGAEVAAAGKASGAQYQRIGLGMQNVGRMMTQFVTIPVVAGFALAAYSGIKFENTLLKIKNLTGTTAAATKEYGDKILALSKVVGVGPQALAEAFYFVASSGFKAEEAMTVLTAAAKASAAGLGDVQVTTDVITSAMNAYGHSNLSAARAVDILMKTIEVGKAEPEALAASLGRIMPIAAKLGVPLGQVGGMIAGLTLTGNSAAEAVTSLRGTMIALAAPAKMSIEQLKLMGLSYQDVTRSIKDKGLIATLQMLYEKTDGNMLQMRKLIPNVRALNGVMSLLGANYKRNVEITKEVIDSNGKLDKSFEFTQKQTIQKLKVAWASIQASFVEVGRVMLPELAKIATGIAKIANAFSRLPDSAKGFILWAALIVAAAGPVLMILGSLTRAYGILKVAQATSAIASSLSGGASMAGGMGMAGLAASIPKSAIIATLAVAVSMGIAEGIQQAKKNKEAQLSFWQDFWSTSQAIRKGMGDILAPLAGSPGQLTQKLKDEMNAAVLAAKADLKPIILNLEARLDRASYENFHKFYAEINAMKAMAKAGINLKLALTMGPVKLTLFRNDLMRQFNITKSQATDIMRRFGIDVSKILGDKLPADIRANRAKLKAAVERGISGPVGEIVRATQKSAKEAVSHVAQIPTKAAAALRSGAPKVKQQAVMFGTGIVLPFKTTAKDVGKHGTEAGEKYGSNLGKGKTKAVGAGVTLAAAAKKPVQAVVSKFATAGTNAGMGFAAAVGSMAAVNLAAANGAKIAQAALDGVNKVGHPGSPWKTTTKQGMDMALGLAAGIKKGQKDAVAAAAELAQNILSVMEAGLGIGAAIGQMRERGLPSNKIAKKWATRVTKMVKAIYAAMKREVGKLNLLDTEKGDKTIPGAGTKFSAFATLVGDIGGIFSAFSELTPESVEKAIGGMKLVQKNAKIIAAALVKMVKAFRREIGKYVVTDFAATNAGNVAGIAGNLADIITTFSGITGEKGDAIDLAVAGIQAAEAKAGELAAAMKSLVGKVVVAITGSTVTDALVTLSGNVTSVAGDIATTISTFAELTAEGIDKAVAGLDYAATRSGELADAMVRMVKALAVSLENVVVSPEFVTLVEAIGSVAGGVAGLINDLMSMTEEAVQDAIYGAGWVSLKAKDLGDALRKMVGWLTLALQGIDATSLAVLQAQLAVLAEIASAISSIVNDLAEMTSEKLTAATNAGAALGEGFYKGLLSWHARIIAEATAIARDTAAALGGGGGSSTAAPAYSGGGTGASGGKGAVVVNDNSRLIVNLPPSLSPIQARSIAASEISAYEARKAVARAAAARGMVRS